MTSTKKLHHSIQFLSTPSCVLCFRTRVSAAISLFGEGKNDDVVWREYGEAATQTFAA